MAIEWNIEIPKQDYLAIPFSRKVNSNKVQFGEKDLLFMTAKENFEKDEILFQKSLDNGIVWDEENKRYLIEIQSEDTQNCEVNKKYGYDITVYYDEIKPKQLVVGELTVGKKFTLNKIER